MFDQPRTISPAEKFRVLALAGTTLLREVFSRVGSSSSTDLYSTTQPESTRRSKPVSGSSEAGHNQVL
jgi:hypothetical protein